MNQSIDAVVLAGNRGASLNFAGGNKNFLVIEGKPILEHVLDALEHAPLVSRIIVVGPLEDITALIGDKLQSGNWQTPIDVIEQHNTLIENAWHGFTHAIGENVVIGEQPRNAALVEKPVLFLAGDIPLVSSEEISEFLQKSFDSEADYCCGMSEERSMRRFYPTEDKPGVEMAYLHLSTGSYRLNNMHFARPFKMGNLSYVQRVYRARYQKQTLNILKIAGDLFSTEGLGLKAVWLYARLQFCVLLQALRMQGLLQRTRASLSKDDVIDVARILLQARATIVETTRGGAAIDVDNKADFEAICLRFQEFKQHAT